MIGRKLLHYEILASVGVGGMGEVWRAHDSRLDREVAIKILPLEAGSNPMMRERLVREARAASSLIHPNIITIHEINAADGRDFIVMEYVRGEPLSAVLAGGRLPVKRALEYAIQIGDALNVAHEVGIVHRDLKPGNVMISPTGLVKVLDFGIAKRLPAAEMDVATTTSLTVLGVTVGTPAYMSPEQTLGDPVDARSDIFSFGVLLYQMLAGAMPFKATTTLSLVRQIVHETPPPLRAAAPEVPEALGSIVDRCLAKMADDRFPSAAAVVSELRRVAAQIETAGATAMPATSAHQARPRRRERSPRDRAKVRRLATIGGIFALLALAGWAGRALVEWVRGQPAVQRSLSDADASPLELTQRAFALLQHYYREGNLDTAVNQLNLALQKKSPYPLAEARLSLGYLRRNQISPDAEWRKQALAHADRAVAGDDQLAVAHVAQGAALALAGNFDKAAAAYARAATLDPSSSEMLWRLGDLSMARRDPAAAEQHYRRAVDVGPKDWEARTRLGVFYYRQGRYTDALEAYLAARDLAPDHARMHSNLGAVYHQLGRPDEAAAAFQRSLEITPDSITYSNLGTLLYFEGKYQEAQSAFERAVALGANSYLRWGNLGDAARMTDPGGEKMHESYTRAIQLAREALAKNPDDVVIRSNIALYQARNGEIRTAIAAIDEVLAQKTLQPAVLFNCGLVAEIAGQRARAIDLLGRALAAGYQLGEIQHEPDLVKLRADPNYHRLAARYDK